jgi:hypothetical protein
MTGTDYDQRVSQNVLSLIQMTGLRYQKTLVAKLGWTDAGRLSRLLKGESKWTVTLLAEVGAALGFQDDPFILTRPISEIVGATGPAASATGTDGPTHGRFSAYDFPDNGAIVIPFPQVTGSDAVFNDIPATLITLPRQRTGAVTIARSAIPAERYGIEVNRAGHGRSA